MNTQISIPTLLDIGLSLTFVFFIVSTFVSGIWEFIGTVLRDKRSTLLRTALEQMIGSPAFAMLLYDHPLIKGHIVERPWQVLEKVFKGMLMRQVNPVTGNIINSPSYIAPSVFSRVLLGLLEQYASPGLQQPTPLAQAKTWIQTLPTSTLPITDDAKLELQKMLLALVQDAGDIKDFIANIEKWYTEYMNRLSGYYKTYSQQGIRGVAIFIVLLFNLDAANLTIRLYHDPALRATLVSQAQELAKTGYDTLNSKRKQQVITELGIKRKFHDDSIAVLRLKLGSVADSLKKLAHHQDTLVADSLKKLAHRRDTLIARQRKLATAVQDTILTQLNYLLGEGDYLKQLPFGWTRLIDDFHDAAIKGCWTATAYVITLLLGWIIMVAAVSFGAPFWFDMLLKLVNVRNAGKNPSEKT